eukprot:4088982-Prymnesium_polylepis.1
MELGWERRPPLTRPGAAIPESTESSRARTESATAVGASRHLYPSRNDALHARVAHTVAPRACGLRL